MRAKILVPLLLLAMSAGAGFWFTKRSGATPAVPLRIAIPSQMSAGSIYLAQQRGFFDRRGLAVTVKPFILGKQALQAVLDDQADLAVVADVPFMLAYNRGEPIVAVATVFASRTTMAVLARRDRGIASLDDLKGKRLGTVAGTNAQYFLDKLLRTRNIPATAVNISTINPEQFSSALARAEVDALTAWNPQLSKLEEENGGAVVRLMAPDIFVYRFILVGKKEFVRTHSEQVRHALAALADAVADIQGRPQAAMVDIARAITLTPKQLSRSFQAGDYVLALDQSLLLSLEDQTRWALSRGMIGAREIPNYLDALDQRALRAVDPGAVKIIQ